MIALRHVHIFLKAGLTIEHDAAAETLLFNVLDFIIALATFDLWAGRYVRLRYRLRRLSSAWRDDLALAMEALGWLLAGRWVFLGGSGA